MSSIPGDGSSTLPIRPPRISRNNRSSRSTPDEGLLASDSPPPCTNDSDKPQRPHRLHRVSVSCPKLCRFCNDFVVTPRCNALRCVHCESIFHTVCSSHVIKSQHACSSVKHIDSDRFIPVDRELPIAEQQQMYAVSPSEQPLSKWNHYQVASWLTVVGLGRFVVLFLRRKIDGHALAQLVPHSAELDQVVDPFARQALRRAIMVLVGSQPDAGDQLNLHADPVRIKDTGQSHDLVVVSFLREVVCAACKLPLLGLYRQGLQCRACGVILHRICRAARPLSACSASKPTDSGDTMTATVENIGTLHYDHLPSILHPYSSAYLGICLTDQLTDTCSMLPRFLSACITTIEQAALLLQVDLVAAYQQSASTVTLSELHQRYAFTIPSEQPSDRDHVVRLTQLLKAFLRDLPICVIPEQFYADFCSLPNTVNSLEKAQQFVDRLPPVHRLTLLRVMEHLNFAWNHQRSLESSSKDSGNGEIVRRTSIPIMLLLVFRSILLRPPWHLLPDFTFSLNSHLQSLQLIFRLATNYNADHCCSEDSVEPNPPMPQMLSLGSSSPPPPIEFTSSPDALLDAEYHQVNSTRMATFSSEAEYPTIDSLPTKSSVEENLRDLSKHEWFWGDVTQSTVREIMDGLPDGYFMVRVASDSSAGAYTLAVRHHGENKLVRIYHRGNYFGVVDPPPARFRFVSELIDYYRCHTKIDGKLMRLQPVSRKHFRFSAGALNARETSSERNSAVTSPTPVDTGVSACNLPNEQLVVELNKTEQELSECEGKLKGLASSSETVMRLKEEEFTLARGCMKAKKWFEAQSVQLRGYTSVDSKTISRLFGIVQRHLDEINDSIEHHNYQVMYHSNRYQELLKEKVDLATRCRKLTRKAHEIRLVLKDRNLNQLGQSCHLDEKFRGASAASEAILKRNMWFVAGMSRESAEALLCNTPKGTFLIRSSADGQKLVLSISLFSSVQHCLVHCVDGRYGFVESACTFDSLEALVSFYHTRSLKEHHPLLTTTLRFPIYMNTL